MFKSTFLLMVFFSAATLIAAAGQSELPWEGPSGKGLGIGYSNGLWGRSFAQEINTKIPFWQSRYGSWGFRGRGILVHHQVPRFHLGGRAEFYGSSSVLLNVVRVYGGGGYQLFAPVGRGTSSPRKISHGLGGYYGFEFFFHDVISFTIEIGGQGDGEQSGATVMGGMSVYPCTRF